GLDTRRLTRRIRDKGPPNGVVAHNTAGTFDLGALHKEAKAWPGLNGMDLAKDVTCAQSYAWSETRWNRVGGFGDLNRDGRKPAFNVVAIDYGVKRNILRCLADAGCKVTVVPATTSADDILRHQPDGVFLSNGPGDPAATGVYAVPVIQKLIASGIPIFGICLGHQMLALAVGAKTYKLPRGHRGANQPVKDLETGKVEITSQNHGFCVDRASLPKNAVETHASLFDGVVEGLRLTDKPVFSVQYHPEASPGPQDSHYLFERFTDAMAKHRAGKR
ncbi:MAG: glutamine-hydrolyzing carbamoyl-phosphate synthase small subunit, partial [Alphaproteobacteria bacterium]|nr:glutamine-hydrolyzing carbamoyl-phosphate synthase small subunit [Alphaproteobacteria bacterium]